MNYSAYILEESVGEGTRTPLHYDLIEVEYFQFGSKRDILVDVPEQFSVVLLREMHHKVIFLYENAGESNYRWAWSLCPLVNFEDVLDKTFQHEA